jgi:hypothetical protein
MDKFLAINLVILTPCTVNLYHLQFNQQIHNVNLLYELYYSIKIRTNVAFRLVRLSTVVVKSQKYYIFCVCGLSYPVCKAHAPYDTGLL